MPWFDAVTTALTTISTGGFSVRNESIAYYQSSAVNWIIVVFMFVSSVNFTLLFLAGTRRWREVLRSDELRVYSGIVFGSSALIALRSCSQNGPFRRLRHRARGPFRSQRSFPPPATAQRISTSGRSSAVLCCSS